MKPTEQRSLTKEQKEAVGLLSIGTFLECLCVQLRRLCWVRDKLTTVKVRAV